MSKPSMYKQNNRDNIAHSLAPFDTPSGEL